MVVRSIDLHCRLFRLAVNMGEGGDAPMTFADPSTVPQPGMEGSWVARGAPPASLLSLFGVRMSELREAGIVGMAMLWTEFVKHLRARWESAGAVITHA